MAGSRCVPPQERPAVLHALEGAAAALHTPPDVFLALFDKTLPTLCGLGGAWPAAARLYMLLCGQAADKGLGVRSHSFHRPPY